MTTDEPRAKFEAFCKENHWCVNRQRNGDYKSMLIENMWIGYRAAHSSRDAEVEALRKDAERYKLLRSCSGHQAPFCVTQNIGHDWIIIRREELDEAIDAAMREESK